MEAVTEVLELENLNLPIPAPKAKGIWKEFGAAGIKKQVSEWAKKANELVITDASQLTEMKAAGEGKKFLQKIRTGIEKKRTQLKDESLQTGRAIDKIAKELTALIKPIEDDLEAKEKFAELLEKQRQQELHDQRLEEISPYLEAILVGVNYGALDNGTYQAMLSHAKQEHADRIEEEKAMKAAMEAEARKKDVYNERRVALAPYSQYGFFDLTIDTTQDEFDSMILEAKEAKEISDKAAEQRRVESEAKAAEAQAELDKLHVSHKRERALAAVDMGIRPFFVDDLIELSEEEFQETLSQNKVAFELKAEQDRQAEAQRLQLIEEKRLADLKAEQDRKAAAAQAKKAALAPDVDKLKIVLESISAIQIPELTTEHGILTGNGIRSAISRLETYISDQIEVMQ